MYLPSNSGVAINNVRQLDRVEKTQVNNQMRAAHYICHGAEIAPMHVHEKHWNAAPSDRKDSKAGALEKPRMAAEYRSGL